MDKKDFDKDRLIDFWLESSDDDFETMEAMHSSKRYTWTLFVGHLLIEKLLKAVYVKANNKMPPYIHNLLRLAEKCNIDLDENDKLFYTTVTAFNINARYDDYKRAFQKICTPNYTAHWVEKIKEKRKWIKKQLKA